MKLANREPSRTFSQADAIEHTLTSGRTVVIAADGDADWVEVRSPDGEVEVRIVLGAEGPVVQVRAARLELEAAGTVRFDCRRLEVETREDVRIESGKDIHMNGKLIRLNSPEEVSRSGALDSPG